MAKPPRQVHRLRLRGALAPGGCLYEPLHQRLAVGNSLGSACFLLSLRGRVCLLETYEKKLEESRGSQHRLVAARGVETPKDDAHHFLSPICLECSAPIPHPDYQMN